MKGRVINMKNDSDLIKKRITENIIRCRENKGMSKRQLAKLSEVDEKIIRRLEDCDYEYMPTLTSIIKIANVLEINFIDLLI
jgi:ribosome-binding protein aMBF1 (putative translation factor)